MFNTTGRIRVPGETICLEAADQAGLPVLLASCSDSLGQVWSFAERTGHLVNAATKLCLDPKRDPLHPQSTDPKTRVTTEVCGTSELQRLQLDSVVKSSWNN